MWRIAPCALVAATVLACGEDRRDGRAGPEVARPAATGERAPGGATGAATPLARPLCPATGLWQLCSLVERLDRAGLAPRHQPGRVVEPPLSSPGVAILLGRSELRVFIYPDRGARERDQAKLDATKYVTARQPLSMQVEPTVIASENLLAILRSRSDHQRERVSDALTAGPPQPSGIKG